MREREREQNTKGGSESERLRDHKWKCVRARENVSEREWLRQKCDWESVSGTVRETESKRI